VSVLQPVACAAALLFVWLYHRGSRPVGSACRKSERWRSATAVHAGDVTLTRRRVAEPPHRGDVGPSPRRRFHTHTQQTGAPVRPRAATEAPPRRVHTTARPRRHTTPDSPAALRSGPPPRLSSGWMAPPPLPWQRGQRTRSCRKGQRSTLSWIRLKDGNVAVRLTRNDSDKTANEKTSVLGEENPFFCDGRGPHCAPIALNRN